MTALPTSPAPVARTGAAGSVTDAQTISLLHQMVAIRSHSGDEGTLAAFLVGHMRRLGLDARIDQAGNAVGTTPVPAPVTDIVLLGHMDTVPGDLPVRIADGLLHGRGSVDAKGPLAAFIFAAATATLPPNVRVVVIGAVEEESATSKGARFAAQSFSPSACIIGEPSSAGAVTLGYKGRLLAEYTLRLPCGHTAGPNSSPADHAVAWWHTVRARIDELNAGRTSAFDSIQAGLRSINTDSDGLVDRVRAVAGFRLPLGIAPQTIESICSQACRQPDRVPPHAPDRVPPHAGSAALRCSPPYTPSDQSHTTDPTITFTGHENAYVTDRHNPLVRAFTTSIRESGATPRLLVKTGTSDMNVVGPIWNCPIVAYGPGDSSLDHTPHEHINLDEYLRSIRILRAALERTATELVSKGKRP